MVNARTIGQGKDIQANFQKNFGKGSNSLIRAAGNTIAAGISAAFGDPAGAVSHGVKAFSEIKNVGNMVLNAKKN